MGVPRAERPGFPPGYGINSGAEGLLAWDWASERLGATREYWLATVRADGRPHLAPVWGLWFEERFWFATDTGSVKARNLEREPRCSVSTDSGIETVIVEGVASRKEHPEVPSAVVDAYLEKYDTKLDPSLGPLFVVEPNTVLGFREPDFPNTATRWQLHG
jgi:PPOX class probable F420-dependent enzyme